MTDPEGTRRGDGEGPPLSEGAGATEVYDLFRRGSALLASRDFAAATVPLERARRLEPDKASIREALGIAYFRLRRYEEAGREFRAVLELSPADDYAHYALARCLEKRGRAAEANGHYKLASSLRPGTEQYDSRIRHLG